MMQKFTLLFIIFCSSISIFSQNLVPNPSFEEFEECPWDVTLRHKKMLIPQWYLPNKGTSDYFNNCATFQVDIPNNFMGNLWAINGNAYVGIILKEYHSKDTTNRKARDYREYLQAELKNPLEKGKKYFVKMHFAIANYSTYAVNRLGIYFSEKKITRRKSYRVMNYQLQVQLSPDRFIIQVGVWHTLSDTIIASGNEKFITIGNFFDDKKTKHHKLNIEEYNQPLQDNINHNGLAYYYVDLIVVEKIN